MFYVAPHPRYGQVPRPTPPALPTELLQEILALALVDQDPGDQQLTRNRFRLVCKDWYSSLDYWKNISVVGSNSVARLGSRLRADQLGLAGQAVCEPGAIEEALIVEGVDGDNDSKYPPTAASLTACLLELLPGLKRLTLAYDERYFEPFSPVAGRLKLHALAQLKQLQRFHISGGAGSYGYNQSVSLTDLGM